MKGFVVKMKEKKLFDSANEASFDGNEMRN